MNQIICHSCGKSFTIDEAGYADILKQVRNKEFDEQLHERLELAEQAKLAEIELAKQQAVAELREVANNKESRIQELQAQLAVAETQKQLALMQAISAVEKERDDLARDLEVKQAAFTVKETSLKDQHRTELAAKDEIIAQAKDFKARQSTKDIGESLEIYCENEFNAERAGAFPLAYFEKDNDVMDGTKGDYIFREKNPDGIEIVSIMFEMKNEADDTAPQNRKKNDDFLKKLDKDRRDKGCEYAVLVSLLETDSRLYNRGIVDKSHLYPKMYVVRPQFFIPMITLLRNAALNSLQYKEELAVVNAQNLDVTNFETKLQALKDGIDRNHKLAADKFATAIKDIDNVISTLERVKLALVGSQNNLRLSNDKAKSITVRSLTRGNPTMTAAFAAIERNAAEVEAEVIEEVDENDD